METCEDCKNYKSNVGYCELIYFRPEDIIKCKYFEPRKKPKGWLKNEMAKRRKHKK